MSRLTRDGTAETVSRDQILRHERGQRNIHFPCSADHEQDWQPYPVDPYSCYMCDYTYIHIIYVRIQSFKSNIMPVRRCSSSTDKLFTLYLLETDPSFLT